MNPSARFSFATKYGLLLAAMMAVGMSMMTTSCSSSDDYPEPEPERETTEL